MKLSSDITQKGNAEGEDLHHEDVAADDDHEDDDDDDDEDEELVAACRDELQQKRLSMESGYSPPEDDVVTVEMRENQQQLLPMSAPLAVQLDHSEASERLSLPSSQTDGKLANRDSGIDSISSPSHSEELCFAGVDDGGVAFPCSPALLPRLSSSSSYAGEGGEEEATDACRGGVGTRRRRDFSEEGDSDLEEEDEAELTLVVMPPPSKADRQDSIEVRRGP